MASASRQIWEAIDRDVFVRNGLERGLINFRALARELQERLELETSTAGIVSAIQRYARVNKANRLAGVEKVLRGLRITTRTQIVSVALRKQADTLELIPNLFNSVDWSKGEAIRVIQAEESVKVILDQGNLEHALKLVPNDRILGTRGGLAELSIRLSREAMETPGCLLMLLAALYAHSINVWELLMASPEVLIFLHEDDLATAHQALMQLSRPPGPSDAAETTALTPD